MNLRPARPGDTPLLQRIEKAARSRYLTIEKLSFAASSPPIPVGRLEKGDVTVAELDGNPIGFMLARPMDGMSYIANISVDAGLSGRGIGAALIAAAEERAATAGLSALVLVTFKLPRWNGPWFRGLGFSPIPDERIGADLRAIFDRHARFMDISARETLWRPAACRT